MLRTLYSPINNTYFCPDTDKAVCENCKHRANVLFMASFWRRKDFTQKLLCENCLDKLKQDWGVIQEQRQILFIDTLPEDCIPVFIRPPELQDSRNNDTVYDLADKQREYELTHDKTRYSGRGSWVGAQIGMPDKKMLEQKDRELNLKEGLKVLEYSKNADKP